MARAPHLGLAAALVAAWLLPAAPARAAATVVIDNADMPGQGLNDATPFTPAGGNAATTLGAARLAVFQKAGALWGATLTSSVTIRVSASFAALSCNATSGVIASTGASTIHRDFPNAPLVSTWYPQALANSIAGADLDPTSDDIETTFNSAIGNAGCMTGTSFYLGFDGHPGSGQIDMLTVSLHEFAHGLGFQTFEDISTGAKVLGLDDVYLRSIRELNSTPPALSDMSDAQRLAANVSDPNLYWSGSHVQGDASLLSAGLISGHVRLFAPSPIQPGSSVSHYSTAVAPNQLMEPVYTGPNHDLGLTVDLLRDIGWPTGAATASVPAAPGAALGALAAALGAIAARRLRRSSSRCVH
jgi:hypothetical protein